MKSEPDRKEPVMPMAASSSANEGGAGSCPKSTGAPKKLPFLWKDCANLVERDRIDIKQQAVLDGLRLGERLSGIFKNRIEGEKQDSGAEELADWAEKFQNAKELYEAPYSTIGLIGALGSGKSTLLNALLGEQDFLPSSHDGAGTGAACKVQYKHGADGYRAEIKFRSRQGFTKELDKLFQNLEAKRGLLSRMEEDPDTTDMQEIEDQLDDIRADTTETLETLRVIFVLAEGEDLGVTSTGEFFGAHPFEFLGTLECVTDTDRETFVNKMKPYMDSTPSISEGQERILWPLIEHVTLFIKSDILRYGLELVDLPGLGDVVESRSRVAERFSQHLDITAIVAPAIRATEEKAVIGFIKKRQECEMRMNGKFNRNALCVIVSKSEDMDLNVYLSTLNNFCGEHNVSRLRDTGKVYQAIETAEAHLGYHTHLTLASFRIGAQSVHPHFRKKIQSILTPVFEKAYEITGGGSVSRRNELLKKFAASHSAELPVKACKAMEAALAELIQRHVKDLEGLADGAVLMVERQMKLLLGINKASISPAARTNQKILTAEISPHLKSWKLCWQKPSCQWEDHVMSGDLSIPNAELINVKVGEDDY